MFNDHGLSFAMGGFGTAMGAAGQHANTLQNIINQTTAAWDSEHDSRVAQSREAGRQDHERGMMQMQIDAVRQRDAEIQQLRQLIAELRQQLSQRGGSIEPGQVIHRVSSAKRKA